MFNLLCLMSHVLLSVSYIPCQASFDDHLRFKVSVCFKQTSSYDVLSDLIWRQRFILVPAIIESGETQEMYRRGFSCSHKKWRSCVTSLKNKVKRVFFSYPISIVGFSVLENNKTCPVTPPIFQMEICWMIQQAPSLKHTEPFRSITCILR